VGGAGSIVKALSIRQPWVELILLGRKEYEIRSWTPSSSGQIWLHAGLSYDRRNIELAGLSIETLVRGALVGTAEIIDVLKRRFPHIHGPQREDICYATSNRQWAVKEMLSRIDLLLVIGSHNSSNSNRLVEVARLAGVKAHLIDDETQIDERWFEDIETVGLTSGASAPERLVARVCDWFRAEGVSEISSFSSAYEDVVFRLPVELRRAETSAA